MRIYAQKEKIVKARIEKKSKIKMTAHSNHLPSLTISTLKKNRKRPLKLIDLKLFHCHAYT